MPPMSDYVLLMRFLDGSESFAHGFEAGLIWGIMDNGKPIKDYMVHTANLPQIKMMAKRFHYDIKINISSGEWSSISAAIAKHNAN